MPDKIQEHYSEEEIQILNMNKDLNFWVDELKFMVTEITFFKQLLAKDELKFNTSPNYKEVKQILAENLETTKKFLEELIDYDVVSNGIQECDDLSCETYYLNEHQDYKKRVRDHLKLHKDNKQVLFKLIQENL
ncbi:hypothetical protein ACFSQ0_11000 [Mesonia sediminis]|uniref:Uncharacterized protein n=1 Tax=Mesonia sediminis TaxID=1703946 RepID=A0ABW5SHA3_9FLAO